MSILSKKDQQRFNMKESEPVNKLYPLNMRDNDTKSGKYEIAQNKKKQKTQYQMLLEQENDLKYPKNEQTLRMQKQVEDEFFSAMAKRAAVQEINDVIEQRQQKLNKNMTIK